METLKLLFVQVVLGYLVQSVIFIWALHLYTKTKIQRNQFILTSLIALISIWILRNLPISLGVQTLMNLLVLMLLGMTIIKLPIIKSVIGTAISAVALLATESVAMLLIRIIYGADQFEEIMATPYLKAVAGIPANILFALAVLFSWLIIKRLDRQK